MSVTNGRNKGDEKTIIRPIAWPNELKLNVFDLFKARATPYESLKLGALDRWTRTNFMPTARIHILPHGWEEPEYWPPPKDGPISTLFIRHDEIPKFCQAIKDFTALNFSSNALPFFCNIREASIHLSPSEAPRNKLATATNRLRLSHLLLVVPDHHVSEAYGFLARSYPGIHELTLQFVFGEDRMERILNGEEFYPELIGGDLDADQRAFFKRPNQRLRFAALRTHVSLMDDARFAKATQHFTDLRKLTVCTPFTLFRARRETDELIDWLGNVIPTLTDIYIAFRHWDPIFECMNIEPEVGHFSRKETESWTRGEWEEGEIWVDMDDESEDLNYIIRHGHSSSDEDEVGSVNGEEVGAESEAGWGSESGDVGEAESEEEWETEEANSKPLPRYYKKLYR
ncbi:hypothetical protein DFP72DRAFT_1045329 [Ephemerocybe angulata]|uniref:Uncharacterized protein n=1 Tax=Ephemerocybe angulata TaxID=980116 RepID=A0A8H6HZT5_9AGAR|nr:hypothetical protein DFP72DRAFT_1045329 [Tulosesus angulatus]